MQKVLDKYSPICYNIAIERTREVHKMKHTHAAVNPLTGEIITATRSKTIRQAIRDINAYDKARGVQLKSKWFFAHGKDCEKKAFEKAYRK